VVGPGKIVWLCPGQGTQKVGMGKDLAARFPAARLAFEAIDDALGFRLSQVMFEGPEDELTATNNAQPAILAHSVAVFSVLGTAAAVTAAAAGHSLGEYSAYVTAGALSAPDAATLVRQRGDLMQRAGQDRPGAMAVVLGQAEIYLHSGGQYEWDSCAPVAVAKAHGLHCSRLDGSEPIYNRPDTYMPDILICRPEYADAVFEALARAAAGQRD